MAEANSLKGWECSELGNIVPCGHPAASACLYGSGEALGCQFLQESGAYSGYGLWRETPVSHWKISGIKGDSPCLRIK